MNGKKAKLLRRIARAATPPGAERRYEQRRTSIRASAQLITVLGACERRFYQLLKRQAPNGVRVEE